MAFPKNLLNTEEELVLDLRPHWLYLAKPALVLAASVILGLVGVVLLDLGGTAGSVLNIVLGVAFLAALGWFGWSYLVWNNTMFVLTSDRLITRRGVLSKQGVEIPLERINTVFFQQSFFERLVGAGDLAVESAGERGTDNFTDIRKPSVVQKEIYVQIEANENRKFDRMHRASNAATAQAVADATAVQSSIPEQIQQLAELHQRGVLSDAEFAQKKAELLDRM